MSEFKRPLTRHENQIRLLYEYVDEIIGRLDVIKASVDKLERLEIMLHGAEGAPGLIEVIEWLSFEVSRAESIGTVLSSNSSRKLDERVLRIEELLAAYSKRRVVGRKKISASSFGWILVSFLLLIGVMMGGGGFWFVQKLIS
ncbi:hypothetical protein [Pseudomonas sp. PDM11]|uniref:hypothetical protein n=1 Tax=Pseudomonas sp. PDM11 TaxID=2769309 RepID=UPI0017808821|nr:hypothetical protein [Pseudomonas sp. PDM11]MBD9399132.1 hypothetical protein [Pseudomonas sp. PDM11]